MSFLSKLFSKQPATDFAQLMAEGATIVDVRTPGEYAGGHISGSVNMPLDSLRNKISALKKDKPVITCCASGIRSKAAISLLQSLGFTKVYNGGSWYSLKNKIEK